MSQPIVFNVEGACAEGDHIVVDQWPDLRCEPPVRPEVIYKTTQVTKYVEQPVKEVVTVPAMNEDYSILFWLLPIVAVVMIWWAYKRLKGRRHRTDIYHHKDK